MQVRQAKNDDGPTIGSLAEKQGFGFENWEIDWTDIEPYWLVVEDDDHKIIGAIQFSPGKPLAWLEFMVLDQEIPIREKIVVADQLVGSGLALAQMHGAQGLSTTILEKSFRKQMARQGWTELGDGILSIRRL